MERFVSIGHGAGGRLMRRLIEDVFAAAFAAPELLALDDSALVAAGERLALTTDSYVVKPLFFPGGDIGKLAVCGTVNDLAVIGARPVYLTAGFIIEEGLPIADLERVVASMAGAAEEAGVSVVAGDTKVVERGAADGLFVTTSGVGVFSGGREAARRPVRPGDLVVLNGPLGLHGVAVVLARNEFGFGATVESDCAPLNGLIENVLAAVPDVRFMRDATRGGFAAVLNELAETAGVTIEVEEAAVPAEEAVQAVCELMGIDPLYVANEGKVVVVCPGARAEEVVRIMRGHRYGREAAVVGRIVEGPGRVIINTAVGGARVLGMPLAEQLPRIC